LYYTGLHGAVAKHDVRELRTSFGGGNIMRCFQCRQCAWWAVSASTTFSLPRCARRFCTAPLGLCENNCSLVRGIKVKSSVHQTNSCSSSVASRNAACMNAACIDLHTWIYMCLGLSLRDICA